MDERLPKWLWLLALCLWLNGEVAQGRQMCLSCAFQVPQAPDDPCLNDPWNWPGGNVRARCNFKCAFQVWRDLEKEDFTYAYRGCTAHSDTREDGCYEQSGIQYCYVTCEGDDYCNDWNATDVVNSGPPSAELTPLTLFFVSAPACLVALAAVWGI